MAVIEQMVAEILAVAADEDGRRALWTYQSEDLYRRILQAIAKAERQQRQRLH
jgi:hypothetical protein